LVILMKFGLIVCPACRRAKGVILSCKTTKCHMCGKVIKLEKIKILYKTDSEKKLIEAIGLANAELDDKAEDFKTLIKNKKSKNRI